jgi:hypothetical protein
MEQSLEKATIIPNTYDIQSWWFVAVDPNTPPETLAILSTNMAWSVRWYVADNPNTPLKTLAQLATDEDHRVRYCAARNSSATDFIQRVYLMTEAKEKNATRN